eukprot:623622-Pyramimonas_sp.AAC.2
MVLWFYTTPVEQSELVSEPCQRNVAVHVGERAGRDRRGALHAGGRRLSLFETNCLKGTCFQGVETHALLNRGQAGVKLMYQPAPPPYLDSPGQLLERHACRDVEAWLTNRFQFESKFFFVRLNI